MRRSHAELRLWMHWAVDPPAREPLAAFFALAGAEAGSDVDMGFGLFEPDGEVVGGFGLHAHRGPAVLEIGYWVRSDRAGRGYATAAAGALTDAAFRYFPNADRVEIRCDPANRASAAIPPKLGYRLEGEMRAEIVAAGQTGTQLVWVLDRSNR